MLFTFTLFGIPVSVHWSTILLVLLVFYSAYLFLKDNLKGRSTVSYVIAGIFGMALLILSLFVHETAHALMASAFGFNMTSAGINGLFAYVSNGYSMSAIPFYQEFLIAFAGPASNFLLALLSVPLIYLFKRSLFESVIRYFAVMNIKLGRFNLWPIFILDGGYVLQAALRGLLGQSPTITYISYAITVIFMIYVFTKKKGRFELENLIDRIP